MVPKTGTGRTTIRPRRRRSFIIGLGAALLVAGCGSSDDPSTAEPASSAGQASASGGTRIVQDGRGDVEIPVDPQRVVTTEQTLDLAILGVAPVGARNLEQDTRNYPEFSELLSDSVDLGTSDLDLEAVAALEPDLILTTTGRLDVADQFTTMAPTIFQDNDTPDKKHRWDETLLYYGDILGKKQEAEDLLAAYNARLEDFKTQMGDRLDTLTVSVLRVSDDNMKIYTLGSFAGGVLQDAGLLRPENQNLDAFETEELTNGEETEGFDLSTERLREADADVLFVVTQLPDNETEWDDEDRIVRANADALKSNPLWEQLTASQNEQTFEVGRHWNGESLVDANRMLDDLFELLLGES